MGSGMISTFRYHFFYKVCNQNYYTWDSRVAPYVVRHVLCTVLCKNNVNIHLIKFCVNTQLFPWKGGLYFGNIRLQCKKTRNGFYVPDTRYPTHVLLQAVSLLVYKHLWECATQERASTVILAVHLLSTHWRRNNRNRGPQGHLHLLLVQY